MKNSHCICHLTEKDHNFKNTAGFSGVMIEVGWIFLFIQSNKNRVFLTDVLIPCNSENTSNKLLKGWFCSALISEISLPYTVFLSWMKERKMHNEDGMIIT